MDKKKLKIKADIKWYQVVAALGVSVLIAMAMVYVSKLPQLWADIIFVASVLVSAVLVGSLKNA